MAQDPKESDSADEDWKAELVRRLNEALIAGGSIMAVEFEAMQSAKANDRMDKAKVALLAGVESSDGTDTVKRQPLINGLQPATEDYMKEIGRPR